MVVVAGGYWIKTRPIVGQESLMTAGRDAFYKRNDPATAAVRFREVLVLSPNHYGATFQLAKALDAAGRPEEARPLWEKMRPMAEQARDAETLDTVTARLAKPAVKTGEATQKALMNIGIDALYTRNDPAAATIEFRKVLAANPTHYGATYQLATALDRMGKPTEARPLWESVARLAQGYNDQKTLDVARAQLARTP